MNQYVTGCHGQFGSTGFSHAPDEKAPRETHDNKVIIQGSIGPNSSRHSLCATGTSYKGYWPPILLKTGRSKSTKSLSR